MSTLGSRAGARSLAAPLVHASVLALCVGCSSSGFRAGTVQAPDAPTAAPAPAEGRVEGAPAATHRAEPAPPGAAEPSAAATPPVEGTAVPPATQEQPAPETAYPNIHRRFGLSAGAALFQRFDTTLAVSSDVGAGGILDLEDLLGVEDKSTVLRLDAHYAFNDRHRVDMTYYDIGRNGDTTLNEEVDVGEVTIPASDASTNFDTRIIKAAYHYNFVRDERTVIGFSAGLHFMKLDFGIQSTLGGGVEETLAANLPLPLLGLHFEYALSPKWKLYLGTEFLQVELDALSGWIRDARLGIDHDLFEHFGWGVGFNSFGLNAAFEDDDEDLEAEVDYAFQGFMIYLRTYF